MKVPIDVDNFPSCVQLCHRVLLKQLDSLSVFSHVFAEVEGLQDVLGDAGDHLQEPDLNDEIKESVKTIVHSCTGALKEFLDIIGECGEETLKNESSFLPELENICLQISSNTNLLTSFNVSLQEYQLDSGSASTTSLSSYAKPTSSRDREEVARSSPQSNVSDEFKIILSEDQERSRHVAGSDTFILPSPQPSLKRRSTVKRKSKICRQDGMPNGNQPAQSEPWAKIPVCFDTIDEIEHRLSQTQLAELKDFEERQLRELASESSS